MPRLVLASESPRRAELCRLAGLRVEVVPAGKEPAVRAGEDPAHYVERAARDKLDRVERKVARRSPRPWIIAADTVVVADGRAVLGKPQTAAVARKMLERLSGNTHHVMTGLCVAQAGGARLTRTVDTLVAFRPIGEREISEYLETGEWKDKAGAYAIQGIAGARFCSAIYGSYTNVVGLPVVELREMLRELNVTD